MSVGGLGLAGVLLYLLGQVRVSATVAGLPCSCSALLVVAFLMSLIILLAIVLLVRVILREFAPARSPA